ncbi:MAG: hypothetical protein V2I34_05290 [Bacteroidales bacterium]|jgi:hypothetical protein|nr:hypothetical protein [Bacteroidales bacterium]
MKNKLFKYISFFAALVMIMSACEKSDIDKANEEYDFSKIIPVVQGVSGPSTVVQTFPREYSANYFRGGSTWAWSVSGATLVSTSDDGHDATVDFPDVGDVVITVTETTLGGVTSEPYTYAVTVNAPVVEGVSGPTHVNQTFIEKFSIPYSREGSTWEWTVTDAVLDSVSPDTKEAFVLFDTQGTATVSVVETVHSGIETDPYDVTVTVAQYCPLEDLSDLAGTYTGTDSEGYATNVVTSVDGDDFLITGLCVGWMEGYWGETITEMVPLVVTMNVNGTLEIERQYAMTTDWNGDPYRYEIAATGRWNNCNKTLYIEYDLYYEGESGVTISIVEDIALVP